MRITPVMLTAIVAFTSCASFDTAANAPSSDSEFEQDQQATKMEGAAAGVAIGGALGAMSSEDEHTWYGAALGGIAGWLWGSDVADEKAAAKAEEDTFQAEIERLTELNNTLSIEIAELEEQAQGLAAEFASVEALEASKTASISAKQAARDHAEVRAQELEREIDDLTRSINEALATLSGQPAPIRGDLKNRRLDLNNLKREVASL